MATQAQQLQLDALAPLPQQRQLEAQERELLKSLRSDRDFNVELVERCSKATELMFEVCNAMCSGELTNEWSKFKKANVPRYTMVERFVRRLNGGLYLQRHRDFVIEQMLRLVKFMPGATTAFVDPSIDSVVALESYLTLEEEVQSDIAQHAVEVERERDAHGQPVLRVAAADTDAVRVSMLYDSIVKDSIVVLLGALIMVQNVERNSARMTYEEFVRDLRAWCNVNRPSAAATAAARGGSSSVAAAASMAMTAPAGRTLRRHDGTGSCRGIAAVQPAAATWWRNEWGLRGRVVAGAEAGLAQDHALHALDWGEGFVHAVRLRVHSCTGGESAGSTSAAAARAIALAESVAGV